MRNDLGMDIQLTGNFIVRNAASGNTTNYQIVASNKVGVIVNAPNSVAISGFHRRRRRRLHRPLGKLLQYVNRERRGIGSPAT